MGPPQAMFAAPLIGNKSINCDGCDPKSGRRHLDVHDRHDLTAIEQTAVGKALIPSRRLLEIEMHMKMEAETFAN
jgi:hypothetical protein